MNGQINEFPLKPSGQGDKEGTKHGIILFFISINVIPMFFFLCNNNFITAIKCLIDATEQREEKKRVMHVINK